MMSAAPGSGAVSTTATAGLFCVIPTLHRLRRRPLSLRAPHLRLRHTMYGRYILRPRPLPPASSISEGGTVGRRRSYLLSPDPTPAPAASSGGCIIRRQEDARDCVWVRPRKAQTSAAWPRNAGSALGGRGLWALLKPGIAPFEFCNVIPRYA